MRLFKRKPLSPELQATYNQTYNAQMSEIKKTQTRARLEAVKANAKAAAKRDVQSKGSKVLGGAFSVGKAINKRLDGFDQDKFERFVTGAGGKKKKG